MDRPVIPTLPTDSPAEHFQNATLRPVVKGMHRTLVDLFLHFAAKRKFYPEQTPKVKRREKIKELITRDNRLRGLLFGVVIGHFEPEELSYYLENEGETNRRITNLLLERILDALAKN